jgi:hypothetical protein
MALVGLVGGVVAFVGFFLNFFSQGGTSLASTSSGWFDLIPIFIGLSTMALFLPRYGFAFSGLSLISLGVAFGLRGLIAGLARELHTSSGFGYGTGFWMIAVGSGVLTLTWLTKMWVYGLDR